MKSTWNDRQGNRDRQAVAVLVTADGRAHKFTGNSIPGVCAADVAGYEKSGKWSNTTYTVMHQDTTVLVAWHQDWDTGKTWPQGRWESGYLWLAGKAPALAKPAFDQFVRANWPKTAERWDAVAAGEAEFGKPATAEQLAALEAAKAEVVRLQTEADTASKAGAELASATEHVRWAKQSRDAASERLAKAQAEAAAVAGLDADKLRAETDQIWREVSRLESQAAEARRNAEAKAAKAKAQAELGNSLGSAFAALGL